MNWRAAKLLNQLFTDGKTSDELLKHPEARRWASMEYFLQKKKTLFKTERFDSFYLQKYEKKYQCFNKLLSDYELTETNFELSELEALLIIAKDKEKLLEKCITQKEISTLYFDDAKYLKKGTKLCDAAMQVLGIDTLAVDEHDQQFLYVLHCKNKIAEAIILCENDNQIKKPRLNNIELWYAGGRNTAKLKFVVEPKLTFYYLCDWDNRGIEIFQDIKRNIFPNIQILVPEEPIRLLDIKSKWKTEIDYSLFSDEAITVLKKLIPEKWIEEESIIHEMLKR